MGMKVELAPFEKAYIGKTLLQNGGQRWKFFVETAGVTVIRERNFLTEAEADTPAKRLYVAVLKAVLEEDSARDFIPLARAVRLSNPEAQTFLGEAFERIIAGSLASALWPLKALIKQEAEKSEAANLVASEHPSALSPFEYRPVVPDNYVPSRDELRRLASLQGVKDRRQAGLDGASAGQAPTWTRETVGRRRVLRSGTVR